MIDLDHFKTYNDTYGHPRGDAALQYVAAILAADLRAGDTAYRYGGEEFVVLYPNETAEKAASSTERIRASIEALNVPHTGNAPTNVLTISAGAATFMPQSDTDPSRIVELADQALYEAKQHGRNRVHASGHAPVR